MTTDNAMLSSGSDGFSSVEQAIEDIRAGKCVVVVDDEDRENEGDLICAAALATPEQINFMTREARGLVCVALGADQAERLALDQMVEENTDPNQTAFTVSVDAGPEFGVGTGISVADRATTIQRLAAPNATPQDFRRPGHIFPVQARNGGVLRRVGHSEAAVDLARLAGQVPAGVMCEILNPDGSMARRDDLAVFAKKHGLSFISIAQLIRYRLQSERNVVARVTREIETRFGRFTAIGYKDTLDGAEHLVLVKGTREELASGTPFVRVQHENIITDLLAREQEDVPHEMAQAMSLIEAQGKGVIVYLRHRDDSAHGLIGSLKAYKNGTPHHAFHASKADLRDYGVGAQILLDLGIKRFCMLGKSTRKIVALRGYGLEIVDHMPLASTGTFDFATDPALAESEAVIVSSETVPLVTTAPSSSSMESLSAAMSSLAQIPSFVPASSGQSMASMGYSTAQAHPPAALNENRKDEEIRLPESENPATPVAHANGSTVNGNSFTAPAQEAPPVPVAAANPPAPAQEPAPAPAPSAVVTPLVTKQQQQQQRPARPAVMRMGGQIISNQALFEG